MSDEPPLVTRVEPPLVMPVTDRPGPGFWAALGLTVVYWLVLIGTAVLLVAAAVAYRVIADGWEAVKSPGGPAGSVEALPPDVGRVLAWAFPVGYAAGLGFTLLVVRRHVGRDWPRAFGLDRRPWPHLGLVLVALPGFVVLSDVIASAFARLVDAPLYRATGWSPPDPNALGQVYGGHPWWFVVFAIGVGPGIVEELWCRGYLGRGLVGRYGWTAGVFLTSLFFGLLHAWPPSYVLTTAVMGAALHFSYVVSGSLWVPILLHVLNNGFAGLGAVGVVPGDLGARAMAADPGGTTVLAAAGVALAGLAGWSGRPATGRRPGWLPAGLAAGFSGWLVYRLLSA